LPYDDFCLLESFKTKSGTLGGRDTRIGKEDRKIRGLLLLLLLELAGHHFLGLDNSLLICGTVKKAAL